LLVVQSNTRVSICAQSTKFVATQHTVHCYELLTTVVRSSSYS